MPGAACGDPAGIPNLLPWGRSHWQLPPRCPELLRRAGCAAGRLIRALCWSKGSCSCWLPRRRMAAGI